MRKTWITAVIAVLSTLVVAAPAMAHQFVASKLGKSAGRGYEEIAIPEKPAQPEFIPERMQEFRLGKFRVLCYMDRSKGEVTELSSETFESVNKYSKCGWYPQNDQLHVFAATSATGMKVVYHANGFAQLLGNGEGESHEYRGLGTRETALLIKIPSAKACNIAIPEQIVPIKAEKHPEEEFAAVTYTNVETATTRLRVFPSGFQKKVVFNQELKTLHFKYVGEETQCANLEEFEKQSEEAGGGTGVYKGKIIQEVASGDLSWE
ncbi:MAG TPA: hypothetical protein VGN08_09230 [Solirubrobacteraceae bacterium]|jgi:hypothetical protein